MIAANAMTIAPITVNENTPVLEVVSLLINLFKDKWTTRTRP